MWMVQSGNAIAYKRYSKRYLTQENEAKKKKIDYGQEHFWSQKNGEENINDL